MTLLDKLYILNSIKQNIKNAINSSGGNVADDFTTYADEITKLTSYEHPDFYEVRTKGGTSYERLFYFFSGDVDVSNWDTSKCTNMEYMFNYSHFKSLDLSNWDTSNVKSMKETFANMSQLTSLNISNWDTSNVETMEGMFDSSKLTSLDLSSFDTSKVNDMSYMFESCLGLTSLDLSSFDTSKVALINSMFSGCTNLKEIIGELDLSSLTGGFYPSAYSNPVKNCKALETLYLKNIYKNCTMTNASKWSINLGDTKIKDECLLYIINELPNLYDKGLTATDKIILTLPPSNTLTQEQVQIAIDKGWQVANITY